MTKEGSTKIVNFMTPGGVLARWMWPYKSYSESLLFLSSPMHRSDKLQKYKVIMTKEEYIQIVNLVTPRTGVLMLGRDHIIHYNEYVISSTLSIYSTLIASVLRDCVAAFLYRR